MAFTDDAVKAKLSALNETQESIVTVAQWVMFYKYANIHDQAERKSANRGFTTKATRRPNCADMVTEATRLSAPETTQSRLPSQWYVLSHTTL